MPLVADSAIFRSFPVASRRHRSCSLVHVGEHVEPIIALDDPVDEAELVGTVVPTWASSVSAGTAIAAREGESNWEEPR